MGQNDERNSADVSFHFDQLNGIQFIGVAVFMSWPCLAEADVIRNLSWRNAKRDVQCHAMINSCMYFRMFFLSISLCRTVQK